MARELYIVGVEQKGSFLGFSVDANRSPFTIVGAPLDMSSSFRGGAGEAPARIREASKSLELCSVFTGLDFESIGFVDLGDIVMMPGDINGSLNRIERVVGELIDAKRVVFVLGGEHTITLPAFKALASKSSKPCLLVFDAHTDLRDEYLGSRYNHATVVRRILEETKGRIVLVGARAVSREEVEASKRLNHRINIISIWQGNIPTDLATRVLKPLEECSDIYVSIDIDFLDPSYAPGVQTPEPLGIDPLTLLNLLRLVAGKNIRIVDIVEVSPPHDPADVTSFLAAKIIIEFASLIYARSTSHSNAERCW
uniref:Agmatinase n=1 Tax=Ignisphaera aggregans TaxID=334771 RepID=A0A7C2VDW3_9CREN